MIRRFASSIRSRLIATIAAVRRRPRTTAAAGLLGIVVVLAAGGAVAVISGAPAAPSHQTPTFTVRNGWTLAELEHRIESGDVDAISASPGTAASPAGELVVRMKDGSVVTIDLSVGVGEAVSALNALGYGSLLTTEAINATKPAAAAANPISTIVTLIVPIALLTLTALFLLRMSRRTSLAGRDASSTFTTILPPDPAAPEADRAAVAKGSVQPVTRIALADVAGCDEAKLELTETIEFLRTPERFRRLGARIPRGIMLYGPPGTGKTMLARAVAAEAGVPFHYASGSEFVEKYVGVGAKRVRDLFAQARKLGRGVIFFDEFDAIGKARGGPNSHEEREQTLNQLLVELDGFATTDDVIVIAATNRLDTLDSAVLRPGRFNRKIHVGMPDVKGRREILDVHAKNKPLAITTDLEELARKTYGFSGAMLADLLNEAAILAARRGAETIDPEDLHAGWLKVAVGTSRRRSMDERERSIIAAHEVGHAICGRVHGDKRKVEEISLFAHGEALGVTVSSQEDNDLPSETDLRARLIALMGGRAAEEILFHEVTGGAANDFEQANRIATTMVTKWGMGRDPDAVDGGISGRGALSFLVPTGSRTLPSEVQAAATRATRAILDEAYAEASQTLIAHLETLRRLAAYLVEHERVDGATFDELFDGRREVPTAADEWRAPTARPRAWGDVVDLAGRRARGRVAAPDVAAPPVAVAAAATLEDADPALPPIVAVGAENVPGESAPDVAVASVARTAIESFSHDDSIVESPARGPRPLRAGSDRASLAGRIGRRRIRRSSLRKVRYAAAGALSRAGDWLRSDGLELDQS
ncbi:MAG TPA: AAA family ATPase [Candidatus Limnocylindrales bacterium]|nr:AAA family ATPase [Candidatus Limnocylindrales bacterium]